MYKNHGSMRSIIIFFIGVVIGVALVFLVAKPSVKSKPDTSQKAVSNYKSNNQPETELSLLEEKVLTVGDTSSYDALRIAYLDKNDSEFLPWALYMANRFNYRQAYFDVYYSIFSLGCMKCNVKELDEWALKNLDAKTKAMALEYLKIAETMGHNQAKEISTIYSNQ